MSQQPQQPQQWQPGMVLPLPAMVNVDHTVDGQWIVLTIVDPSGSHTCFMTIEMARKVQEFIGQHLLQSVSGLIIPEVQVPADLRGNGKRP